MSSINFKLNTEYQLEERVACIGYFDGLHLGHRALIQETLKKAREYNVKSCLITFSPDPWVIIKGLKTVEHLTPLKRRVELAKELGIDEVIVVEFTKELSQLSHQDFVKKVLLPCSLKALVCGFDFHYGYKGLGNTETLLEAAEGHFELAVVSAVNEQEKKISSTRIIEYLKDGKINEANRLLGLEYEIAGSVIHGQKKGRTIGFPTANIQIEKDYLLPKPGVYKGKCRVDGQSYRAMINIGHNPTFNPQQTLSVEAHLLNFEGDIYGKDCTITFLEFLREEKKFSSIQELIQQLEKDKALI